MRTKKILLDITDIKKYGQDTYIFTPNAIYKRVQTKLPKVVSQ